MKKNLLTLVLSIACLFLFVGNSFAKNENSVANSVKAVKNLNVVKNIKLNENLLAARYKKSKQNCETPVDACSDAYTHLAWAAGYAYDGCNQYGWGSNYCGQLANWLVDTANWAVWECVQSDIKVKPQKLMPISPKRQKVLEKLDFNYKLS